MKLLKKIFFFAIIIGAVFLPSSLIKIKSFECVSQFGPCKSLISETLSKLKGLSLRDAKKQISIYLTSETSIKNFSIRLKLPSTILVTLVEKKPNFAIKSANEELYAAVDAGGEVLSIGGETALAFVVIPSRPPNLGEKVTDSILFALKIQEKIYSSYQIRSGSLVDESLQVNFPEGYTVLFPLEGDTDQLLGALSLIIYELNRPSDISKIGKTVIKTIDLRFKNPVLR